MTRRWFLLAPLLTVLSTHAGTPLVKPGARVAVVGDSITEQKQYSVFIADYLAACAPELNAHVVQFGWGGETARGFANRIDNDLMPWKPDLVTTCYGMNDGGYRAYEPSIGKNYQDPLREFVGKLKAAGAVVVVGSPGVVDSFTFRRNDPVKLAGVYNENLAQLRDHARQVAETNGFAFANVHDTMMGAMTRAKAALGEAYHVGGGDGVHPAANGQLAMAHAFLKAMGFDGDLGAITVDLKGGAEARNGHRVLAFANGTVEVESTRIPFAFTGDEKSPDGTRSILPFLPFNEELNRLTLVVRNTPSEKTKITWGAESQVFARAELERGVNLAAAFSQHPLVAQFQKIDAAVRRQQVFQTPMIKGTISPQREWINRNPPDEKLNTALRQVRDRLWEIEAENQATVRAVIAPVKHSLKIEAAE